jgi:hypothetical protein
VVIDRELEQLDHARMQPAHALRQAGGQGGVAIRPWSGPDPWEARKGMELSQPESSTTVSAINT